MQQHTYRRSDGQIAVILTPVGKLDVSTSWQFRLKLQECITTVSPHVIVNLGELASLDSSGMTTLVAGLRDTEKAQGSFRLCNLQPALRPVFEISTMDRVFDIYETEADALTVEDRYQYHENSSGI
jgi:anti-sigma B factor antagonist